MTIPALLFSQHSQSIIIWLTKDAPKIQPAAFEDDLLHLSDQAEGLKPPPFIASSIGRRTGELLRDFSGGIEMGNALLAGRV